MSHKIYINKIIDERIRDKIVPCHTEEKHQYKFIDDGTVVDSVTTKLILDKPHLIPWAVEQGVIWLEEGDRWEQLKQYSTREAYIRGAKFAYTATRDDAGNIGTVAHDAAEAYTNEWIRRGEKPGDIRDFFSGPVDARSIASARAVEKLFNTYNVIPIAAELLVGSKKWNSAGTLDKLIMNEKGELELWDYKTSNHINQDTYPMQVAAYAKFFEEMSELKIKSAKIIHLSKDYDKYTVYRVKNLASAFKAFKNIASVYDWKYNGKLKVVKDIKRLKL